MILMNRIKFLIPFFSTSTFSKKYTGYGLDNKLSILACFGRSFDTHHTNEFHIMASIIKYNKEINISNLVFYLDSLKVRKEIVRIRLSNFDDKNDVLSDITTIEHSNYLIEHQLSFNKFIQYWNDSDLIQHNFFESIFGLKSDTIKKTGFRSFDSILFIFDNIEWDNILLLFYLKKITVSGGTISKRHILSNVEANLAQFYLFIENLQIDSKLLYNSYKHTTNSIPYKDILFNNSNLSKHTIKYLKKGKLPIGESTHILEFLKHIQFKFNKANQELTFYLFKKLYIEQYNKGIAHLKDLISDVLSQIESCQKKRGGITGKIKAIEIAQTKDNDSNFQFRLAQSLSDLEALEDSTKNNKKNKKTKKQSVSEKIAKQKQKKRDKESQMLIEKEKVDKINRAEHRAKSIQKLELELQEIDAKEVSLSNLLIIYNYKLDLSIEFVSLFDKTIISMEDFNSLYNNTLRFMLDSDGSLDIPISKLTDSTEVEDEDEDEDEALVAPEAINNQNPSGNLNIREYSTSVSYNHSKKSSNILNNYYSKFNNHTHIINTKFNTHSGLIRSSILNNSIIRIRFRSFSSISTISSLSNCIISRLSRSSISSLLISSCCCKIIKNSSFTILIKEISSSIIVFSIIFIICFISSLIFIICFSRIVINYFVTSCLNSYNTMSYFPNYRTYNPVSIINKSVTQNKKIVRIWSRNYNTKISTNEVIDYKSKRISNDKINTNYHMDSPIYLELQRIILNEKLDKNTQKKIELFLISQGEICFKEKLTETLDLNYYKISPIIQQKLKDSIEDLKKLVYNYIMNIRIQVKIEKEKSTSKTKQNSELKIQQLNDLVLRDRLLSVLNKTNNNLIISVLLGRLLKIISNNNLINKNTICIEVSKDLVNTLIFFYYKYISSNFSNLKEYITEDESLSNYLSNNLNNKLSLTEVIAHSKDYSSLESDSFTVPFGLQFFKFLEELNLIQEHTITLGRESKKSIFIASKAILDDIGLLPNLLDITYKIPMIVEPKKYRLSNNKMSLGGYLLNDDLFISDLIIKKSALREQSQIESKNYIIDMVNNISSVGFKINIQVLDFIMATNSNYDFFINPDFIHPLQTKTNENFSQSKTKGINKKTVKKLTCLEQQKLDSFLSKKQLEMNILGLAFIFKNVHEFFIPVRIDNRGRVYCITEYLNYQGIELAKSLLLFSKGEKILKTDSDAINYLKIFGANCFGNGLNKKSYFDRVAWVNENEENILNFKNGDLISKADSKLLFLSFCFEYENYKNSLNNDNTHYVSYFPIQLDATCNGYQHLSLLTGDDSLSSELNLMSDTKSAIPKDFYSYVVLKLKDYFETKRNEIKNSYESIVSQNTNNRASHNNLDLNFSLNKEKSEVIISNSPLSTLIKTDKDKLKDENLLTGLKIETNTKTDREIGLALEIANYTSNSRTTNLETDSEMSDKPETEQNDWLLKEKELNSYERLLKLNIHRKLIKLPIMVKPYNASLYQMVNYIKEKFDLEQITDSTILKQLKLDSHIRHNLYVYKEDKNIILTTKDLYILTRSIETILYTEFPKLKALNDYLKEIAEICSLLNITITWSVPSGLYVHQYYKDAEAIRLKPFKFSKKTFNLTKFLNKVNKTKQKRALMPNLIHSLDGASLALIAEMFFNIKTNSSVKDTNSAIKVNSHNLTYKPINNFYSIHDCFAVTANNVEKLIKIIKLVYIKIYTDNNYLKEFDLGIINSIKSHYGKDSFDDISKEIIIDDCRLKYPNVDLVIAGKINADSILNANYLIH